MTNYEYLIVGGGMTAAAAIQGIRELDPSGSVGLITAESHPPYNRPPLSKGLWKGETLESIWCSLESTGTWVHTSRRATHLNPESKQVTDDIGGIYKYNKLLLATGAAVRRLPFGGDDIIYFRSLDDYSRLRTMAQPGRRFAVIGGGFIGSEIAAALAMNGCEVTMVFPENGIGSRLFPPELAASVTEMYSSKGVEVLAGAQVGGLKELDGKRVLNISDANGKTMREAAVDGVIAGVGVVASAELAEAAGIEVHDGIRVDASLRTSQHDIYAAGDVASFHNPALDTWMRVEHEDNANTMGKYAGTAMAGGAVTYDHLPFFYSDMFEMGYEAVGEVDSRLDMIADWKEPYKEGVVYYMQKERVRGVLLWNIFGQVDGARRLIASAGPYRPGDLIGRLPENQ